MFVFLSFSSRSTFCLSWSLATSSAPRRPVATGAFSARTIFSGGKSVKRAECKGKEEDKCSSRLGTTQASSTHRTR